MKLGFRDIAPFLAKPDPAISLILVYGPESGLVSERSGDLIPKLIEDINDPMAITNLNAQDIIDNESLLLNELSSIALLGPEKRVIKISNGIDALVPTLKEALALNNTDVKIIVMAGNLAPKSILRSLCEKENNAVAVPCYVEDEKQLSAYIASFLREHGYGCDRDALMYLANNLVGDRMLAKRQLEKLISYIGRTQNLITLDDVRDAVPDLAGQNIDDIVYASFDGNWPVLFRALDVLLSENISFMLILRSIQNHARKIENVHLNCNNTHMSVDQAIKALQPPIFFKLEKQFRAHVVSWDLQSIQDLQSNLIDLETDLKTYSSELTAPIFGQWLIENMAYVSQRRTA